MLFNAKAAFNMTVQYHAPVFDTIKEAANKGKLQAVISNPSNEIGTVLEGLGYNVTYLMPLDGIRRLGVNWRC